MTHVYIIELNYEYEGSEFVDVCIDDLELAKRIAEKHHNDPDIVLQWQSDRTGYHWAQKGTKSISYSINRCEVTEQ